MINFSGVERFFEAFTKDTGRPTQWYRRRLAQTRSELLASGVYQHTIAELRWAAGRAWRYEPLCVGRRMWRRLQVLDARGAITPTQVRDASVSHLLYSTGGGRILPTLTVLPPVAPGREIRIYNEQLIRYAGYRQDETALGDPRNVALTELATSLGWQPGRGPFDVLPLIVGVSTQDPRWFVLPRSAVKEVALFHGDLPWFGELGLRWHALPAIAGMWLAVGGLSYPCIFSGHYQDTEIGVRNLSDSERYNLTPTVARRMGLDTSSSGSQWRDRAAVELNQAVLDSFTAAHVTIAEHHSESAKFLAYEMAEAHAGRPVYADWSWCVAPSAWPPRAFHHYLEGATQSYARFVWPRRPAGGLPESPARLPFDQVNASLALPVEHRAGATQTA